jgi:diguanylate cyclase (GGDEF)-like protein/PAS domain S-box-containing protein
MVAAIPSLWTAMANPTMKDIQFDQEGHPQEGTVSHRHRALRVLFISGDARLQARCVHKLEEAQFAVDADAVLTVAECREQLNSQSYDVVVAVYPSSTQGEQALQLLRHAVQQVPLVLVTTMPDSQVMAEIAAHDDYNYVERDHLAQLPMAVRRALNEGKLRAELEELGKALRHSQTYHRALANNPAYGIFRCNASETFLDVNQTLVTMLGYTTKEELLAASQVSKNLPDLSSVRPLGGVSPETALIQPVEMKWRRKDGTSLNVRLSGCRSHDEGKFTGYHMIAADLTRQEVLEDQLRHEASSDPVTGLANHRRLFETLHAEVCRAERTRRGFSLLLLDLDQLKEINDRFGHQVGDRALCRLAQVMRDCCRSVDTAARQGGDEFAVVLPETDSSAAALVAKRICNLLANSAEEPALSVSVGIASFPKDASTVAALACAADAALYEMKRRQPKGASAARV